MILREQQEEQKGKIVSLEKKIEGMTSNATESQKRIVMLEEETQVMKEENQRMTSKMEKIEKDLATLMENQKTAMPSIGNGVGCFVGAVTVVILVIMRRRV